MRRFYSVEVSQALVARLTRVRFTVRPFRFAHPLYSCSLQHTDYLRVLAESHFVANDARMQTKILLPTFTYILPSFAGATSTSYLYEKMRSYLYEETRSTVDLTQV
jgi:hypothetical protein